MIHNQRLYLLKNIKVNLFHYSSVSVHDMRDFDKISVVIITVHIM